METVLHTAMPIVLLHVVVLVLVVVFIRMVIGGMASRTIRQVRQVEDEVQKREDEIKRDIAEHEQAFASMKQDAEREIQGRRDESRREIARLKEQALTEAKAEGSKIIELARQNEQKLRDQIARQMDDKAIEYGGKVFHLVFSDLMTEVLDRQFISELIDALRDIDKGSITVESTEAEVTVSHALDPAQHDELEGVLRETFGDGVTLSETTDESILGGLILKIGTLEIDGSLRNRYKEAVNEVKKAVHAA